MTYSAAMTAIRRLEMVKANCEDGKAYTVKEIAKLTDSPVSYIRQWCWRFGTRTSEKFELPKSVCEKIAKQKNEKTVTKYRNAAGKFVNITMLKYMTDDELAEIGISKVEVEETPVYYGTRFFITIDYKKIEESIKCDLSSMPHESTIRIRLKNAKERVANYEAVLKVIKERKNA